jgi:hypothetical protein
MKMNVPSLQIPSFAKFFLVDVCVHENRVTVPSKKKNTHTHTHTLTLSLSLFLSLSANFTGTGKVKPADTQFYAEIQPYGVL